MAFQHPTTILILPIHKYIHAAFFSDWYNANVHRSCISHSITPLITLCRVLSQPGGIQTQGAFQQRSRDVRDGGYQGAAEGAERGLRPAGGLRLSCLQVLAKDGQVHHLLGHLGGEK